MTVTTLIDPAHCPVGRDGASWQKATVVFRNLVWSSMLFAACTAKAQETDTAGFRFRLPVGLALVTNGTWKPYNVNVALGLSFQHRLGKAGWWFDWGLTAAISPKKDTSIRRGGGNLSQPSSMGSEMVSVYAGLARCKPFGKALVHWAGGIDFLYTGLLPPSTTVPERKNGWIGGYGRCGLQFRLSPEFSTGPFVGLNVYPARTQHNLRLNPTHVSFGILLAPGR